MLPKNLLYILILDKINDSSGIRQQLQFDKLSVDAQYIIKSADSLI